MTIAKPMDEDERRQLIATFLDNKNNLSKEQVVNALIVECQCTDKEARELWQELGNSHDD